MYLGCALRQEVTLRSRVVRSPAFRRGYRLGYEDVARQVGDSVAEYLADKDPHASLYERAVVVAEDGWTDSRTGRRCEPLGSEWLDGYYSGLKAFRSDLIACEDDEAAEKRLRAAGVTL